MAGVGSCGTADDSTAAGPKPAVVTLLYLISDCRQAAVLNNQIVVAQIELTGPSIGDTRNG